MSSHWLWWGFPFDNLCEDEKLYGDDITRLFGDTYQVPQSDQLVQTYKYCKQRRDFEILPSNHDVEWMTEEQKYATTVYGWTLIVLSSVLFLVVICYLFYIAFIKLFKGVIEPSTKIQNMDFSSLYGSPAIEAFVPRVEVPGFARSFLICDVDCLKRDLIGWEAHTHTYDYYNLIYDVPYPGMKRDKIVDVENYELQKRTANKYSLSQNASKPIFSIVKHWPRFNY